MYKVSYKANYAIKVFEHRKDVSNVRNVWIHFLEDIRGYF